jgi:hypothetical protein
MQQQHCVGWCCNEWWWSAERSFMIYAGLRLKKICRKIFGPEFHSAPYPSIHFIRADCDNRNKSVLQGLVVPFPFIVFESHSNHVGCSSRGNIHSTHQVGPTKGIALFNHCIARYVFLFYAGVKINFSTEYIVHSPTSNRIPCSDNTCDRCEGRSN